MPTATANRSASPSTSPGVRLSADELQGIGVRAAIDTDQPTSRAERIVTALVVASFYIPIAYMLATSRVLSVDAMSRSLSAASAAVGRDPHLEAVGFVWPPFPTMFQVPLIYLERLIPSLVQDGFAGTFVSAVLMTAMVCGVRQWLAECGVPQTTRLLVVLMLAVHPFVMLYAGNGMSEASMLCFLVFAATRLARWWERESPADVIMTGVWLAMAYLSRFEVGLAIILVTAAVGAEAIRRSTGTRRERLQRGVVSATAVAFVPVTAMLAWAAWSWTTIGEPFAQFTSQYGNSAIVGAAEVESGVDRLLFFLNQAFVFGAATLALILLVVWFGTRGLARVVSTLLVMLSPLVFNLAAATNGTTFNFARFTIAVVPAGVMLLGPLLSVDPSLARGARRQRHIVGLVAVVVFLVGSVASLKVLWSGELSTREEAAQLSVLPWPYTNPTPTGAPSEIEALSEIAADIDLMGLDDGSIVTDVFSSFLIVSSSQNRAQFITTPDRDFERAVSAPKTFGVTYFLVPSSKNSNFDAARDAWPGLFEGNNQIGRLVVEWGDDSHPATHYRLMRVTNQGKPGS